MRLFEPYISGLDIKNVTQTLTDGALGFGENVTVFEQEYQQFSKKKFNIATNSASAAAYMIFAYLYEKYGQCDVYTPTLGFTSPCWAALKNGHRLFFVDIDDNLLFCSNSYQKIRKSHNKGLQTVVMPILYGGVSQLPDLKLEGDEITVIDAAHCPHPNVESDFLFFSFHSLKPICMSDGGLIACDSHEANEYLQMYRNFGRLQQGLSYDIVQDGFKFYMNNLNAALGLSQLEGYEERRLSRKVKFEKLLNSFNNILLPHDENSSYFFATLIHDKSYKIVEELKIPVHYPLLHKMKFYASVDNLSFSETKHKSIANIPLHHNVDISSLESDIYKHISV